MAFKTFAPGVLTSSDVNTFLMRQSVITCTAATRPASPNEGMTIYETDTDIYLVYDGTDWKRNLGGWTSFTPTLTNFTLGNGTVAASYSVIGKTVVYRGEIVAGSTTALTTDAAQTITVTIPLVGTNTPLLQANIGNLSAIDLSTGEFHAGDASISSSSDRMILKAFGNTITTLITMVLWNTTNTPFAIATGDRWLWTITYQAA
jgi:hypothetical protein